MITQSQIRKLEETTPRTGYSIIKYSFGYGAMYMKVWVGLESINPMQDVENMAKFKGSESITFMTAK